MSPRTLLPCLLLPLVATVSPTAIAGDADKTRAYSFKCTAEDDTYAYFAEPSIFQWKEDGKKKDAAPGGSSYVVCDPRNQIVHGIVTVPGKADGASGQELTFNIYRYKKADIERTSDVKKELKKRDIWVWTIKSVDFDKSGEPTTQYIHLPN